MRTLCEMYWEMYLISLTKNLWYEEREQLDSGHDGSFYRIRCIAVQKRAVSPKSHIYLFFSSGTSDKFAKDYAIKKSFRHALHLVTAHLHRQNQVAHTLRTRDFWLAKLSIHFPIHFTRRAHEYPVTLRSLIFASVHKIGKSPCIFSFSKLELITHKQYYWQ